MGVSVIDRPYARMAPSAASANDPGAVATTGRLPCALPPRSETLPRLGTDVLEHFDLPTIPAIARLWLVRPLA